MSEHPLVGTVVQDRYRILGVLGEGGMGTVYDAEHVKIGRQVALKTLLPSLAENPQLLARFHREARAASTIGHPSIVDVTDMGEMPDGAPFLVMEKLVGEELAEYGERTGPMHVAELVRIMKPVCSALHAAHEAGIVHRDLKPSNIFLVERPDGPPLPKVLDFGISKFSLNPDDQGLTATGVAVGTPAFMSPEQAQGLKSVDRRTDVYALGVIAYQLLTGRLPFSASSYAALLLAILTADPKPIAELRPDLPSGLSDAVMRAMLRDAGARFDTAAAFVDALAPFSDHVGQAMPVVAEAPPPTRPDTAVLETGDDVDAPAAARPITGSEANAASAPNAEGLVPPTATPEAVALPSAGPPKSLLIGVAVGLLLLLGVGGYVGMREDPPEPESEAPAASPPPAAPAPEPRVAEGEGTPADVAPTEVRVRIRATPSEAGIFLGDVAFPNPMDAHQPRSLTPVTLRVEAPGYEPLERIVIFDDDQSFDFALAPARGGARGRGRRGRGSSPTPAAPATEPAPGPSTPATGDDGVYVGQQGGMRREI